MIDPESLLPEWYRKIGRPPVVSAERLHARDELDGKRPRRESTGLLTFSAVSTTVEVPSIRHCISTRFETLTALAVPQIEPVPLPTELQRESVWTPPQPSSTTSPARENRGCAIESPQRAIASDANFLVLDESLTNEVRECVARFLQANSLDSEDCKAAVAAALLALIRLKDDGAMPQSQRSGTTESEGDGRAVVVEGGMLSLRCPLSQCRMSAPCRVSSLCNHLGAFDLFAFLESCVLPSVALAWRRSCNQSASSAGGVVVVLLSDVKRGGEPLAAVSNDDSDDLRSDQTARDDFARLAAAGITLGQQPTEQAIAAPDAVIEVRCPLCRAVGVADVSWAGTRPRELSATIAVDPHLLHLVRGNETAMWVRRDATGDYEMVGGPRSAKSSRAASESCVLVDDA